MSLRHHLIIITIFLLYSNETYGLFGSLWSNNQKKETVVLSKQVGKECSISVTNISGDISINAEGKEVHVEAIKNGSVKALQSTKIMCNYDTNNNKMEIKTIQTITEPNTPDCKVTYKITIPKTAHLTSVHTGEGNVAVVDTQGATITTKNGSVTVKNSTGPVGISTDNGPISISLNNLIPEQQVTAITGNGHITVTMPANATAQLDAKTESGTVSSNLPIKTTASFKQFNKKTVSRLTREVRGTIGGTKTDPQGLATMDLRTEKGNITLEKIKA